MSGYIGSPAWKATWRRFVPAGDPRNPDYIYLSSRKAWGKLIAPDIVELYGWGPNRYVIEQFPPEEQEQLVQIVSMATPTASRSVLRDLESRRPSESPDNF